MKILILAIISVIFLQSCQRYNELCLNQNRFYISNNESAERSIEDLKSAGFIIKDVQPSVLVEDMLVIYVDTPKEKND